MADGLGGSGPGAGMFNRLFDAGLDIGTTFGVNQLGGVASRSVPQFTVQHELALPAWLDKQTILLGLALLAGAVYLGVFARAR